MENKKKGIYIIIIGLLLTFGWFLLYLFMFTQIQPPNIFGPESFIAPLCLFTLIIISLYILGVNLMIYDILTQRQKGIILIEIGFCEVIANFIDYFLFSFAFQNLSFTHWYMSQIMLFLGVYLSCTFFISGTGILMNIKIKNRRN